MVELGLIEEWLVRAVRPVPLLRPWRLELVGGRAGETCSRGNAGGTGSSKGPSTYAVLASSRSFDEVTVHYSFSSVDIYEHRRVCGYVTYVSISHSVESFDSGVVRLCDECYVLDDLYEGGHERCDAGLGLAYSVHSLPIAFGTRPGDSSDVRTMCQREEWVVGF
jgi:hypothetical protein